MKEFIFTIEVTGFIQAKNKDKAYREVDYYKAHYMNDDLNPTITIKEA
tara:strand:- start:8096 stop:8239 length:144 start_codon:yes stop_codon:yes gene_type:complete